MQQETVCFLWSCLSSHVVPGHLAWMGSWANYCLLQEVEGMLGGPRDEGQPFSSPILIPWWMA